MRSKLELGQRSGEGSGKQWEPLKWGGGQRVRNHSDHSDALNCGRNIPESSLPPLAMAVGWAFSVPKLTATHDLLSSEGRGTSALKIQTPAHPGRGPHGPPRGRRPTAPSPSPQPGSLQGCQPGSWAPPLPGESGARGRGSWAGTRRVPLALSRRGRGQDGGPDARVCVTHGTERGACPCLETRVSAEVTERRAGDITQAAWAGLAQGQALWEGRRRGQSQAPGGGGRDAVTVREAPAPRVGEAGRAAL